MMVYCDSCVLIYLLDDTGIFNTLASKRLGKLAELGAMLATSELARLECRSKPLMVGDLSKLAAFETFFSGGDVRFVPMSTSVFERAAQIRARYRFKLADSLHLAAATEADCDLFLTNDRRLASFEHIAIETLN